MSEAPIGVFDSGVGGTSIWKEIHKLLPRERTIYLADSKNAPYGEKSQQQILELSIKNTELLMEMGCKLIVVACNTATTNAILYLRTHYGLPFIGIEPAIKPAALNSISKVVGVLATKGTLSSSLFHSTTENHANGIKLIEQEGTGLVPLVESGNIDSKETETLLRKYIDPMLDQGMDHLVLGCTHYPYLVPVLQKIMPEGVKIIDSGEAVARQVKAILEKNAMLNTATSHKGHRFYTNIDPKVLRNFVSGVAPDIRVEKLDF
ncbi:glutamate racemase [Zobellia galactanivorans]|uniref:Glutamate racemase n=1 Tax=Zobellia galactanivorans (strain DSM 12802 / CCUG 47099 / CIP 106680 / NCIMB 13871 / Dsij) TaxID=63186 RepID=G0L9Z2_ZOBGA|nr:glutamate racemase [Zobellia galactanivorans]MBU3027504.1 glutamate racemase [Zobellia galactanivorans]MDO6809391.1 glutamate racemase [Zobellia galactanivorans]CAZ94943.1 Glutamate racemase [Zobellia galactanivorans]